MIADVLDTAVILQLVEKNGAFYALDGQKFQGKERTCAYLTATPKTFEELKAKIKIAIEDVRSGKKEIDLEVAKSSVEEEVSEIDAIANEL